MAHLAGAFLRDGAAALAAQRARWALWLPVGLGTGIGLYFSLAAEPPVWAGWTVLGVLLAVTWSVRRSAALPLMAAALAVAAGFVCAQSRTRIVAAPMLAKRTGAVDVVGRILIISPDDGGGARLLLRARTVGNLSARDVPARLRVTWRGAMPPGLRPGQWVRLRAVLRPPPGPVAPGAFDFSRYAFFRRIGGIGFALSPPQAVPAPAAAGLGERLGFAVAALRHDIGARLRARMPDRAGGVAVALVTGERGGIAAPDLAALRDSGLAHLLAISGLHMMLVGAFAYVGLRRLLALSRRAALLWPIKKIAALAAVPVAGAYLVLSGAPISAQRAFLMLSLMALAVLAGRRALSLRVVALSAMAVLLLTPESLMEASFQMSFAAVTALIAFYEAWQSRARSHHGPRSGRLGKAWRWMGSSVAGIGATTLIASLATAPFAAFHFNQTALYALAANLAAMPVFIVLVMLAGVLAVLALPLGLAAGPLAVMGWGMGLVLGVAHEVSAWPGAVAPVPAWPGSALVLIAAGGLWLCLWRGPPRFAGLAPMILGVTIAVASDPPDIVIEEAGRTMAVRDDKGALFLARAAPSFPATVWLRRDGDRRGPEAAAKAAPPDWRCDDLGCVLMRGGIPWLALVKQAGALAEDCSRVRILVSQVPVRGPCEAPDLTIGRFDLWRHGAHALWLDRTGTRVRRMRTTAQRRPWSAHRMRAKRWKRRSGKAGQAEQTDRIDGTNAEPPLHVRGGGKG